MKIELKINISKKALRRIATTLAIAATAYHVGASSGVTISQPSVAKSTIEAKQPIKPRVPKRPKVQAPCK